MSYPTFEEYNILYRKYRERRPISELIDLAGDLGGRNVVDLCCGNGEIGLECRKRGASTVVLVDREFGMLPTDDLPDGIHKLSCDVKDVDVINVDVAICRQGINYWLNKETASLMAKIISRGGMLIFNTFNTKPDKKMTVKEYTYKKNRYIEVNYLRNGMVCHTQICDSPELVNGAHSTQFRWISSKEFEELLSPYFHVDKVVEEVESDFDIYGRLLSEKSKTDIYKCVRNSIEYKES